MKKCNSLVLTHLNLIKFTNIYKIRKYIILVLVYFLFLGCQQKPNCNLNLKVLKSNDSILLRAKKDITFEQFFIKLQEPELVKLNEVAYRFTIIGAFGDYMTYRVQKVSDDYFIFSKNYKKYSDDENNFKETKIIDSLSPQLKTKIKPCDWNEIEESISKLGFWTLPVRANEKYLDGTGYLIEGYNTTQNVCTKRFYHATIRICPNDTTAYKSLFEKIIKLTEVKDLN